MPKELGVGGVEWVWDCGGEGERDQSTEIEPPVPPYYHDGSIFFRHLPAIDAGSGILATPPTRT